MTLSDSIPASSFMRQAAGPTFYVKQGLRRDVAPPSRVIDFHISSIVNDSLYVELQWSAPGNDYDQGRGKNIDRNHLVWKNLGNYAGNISDRESKERESIPKSIIDYRDGFNFRE